MLLVHHQEVEAEPAQDLRAVKRRCLEEAADQHVAAQQARAEAVGGGRRGHGLDSRCGAGGLTRPVVFRYEERLAAGPNIRR
jgi:hypothetical protein